MRSKSATNDQNILIPFAYIDWSVGTIFNILYGFSAGTAVILGPSFAVCTKKFQVFVDNCVEIIADYETEFALYKDWNFDLFDVWPYLMINDKIAAVIYSIRGLSEGCYYGGFEQFGALYQYMGGWEDPAIFLDNFSNNFGYIYTAFRDLIFFMIGDRRTPVKDEYGVAVLLGQLYYFMFISKFFS